MENKKKTGIFRTLGRHAATGAGEGVSTIVKFLVIGAIVIPILLFLGFQIGKINLGGVEIMPPSASGSSEPIESSQSGAVTTINSAPICPDITQYYDAFLLEVDDYLVDWGYAYGDTGHYLYRTADTEVLIGQEGNDSHFVSSINPYSYAPGSWVNVHDYSNQFGALAICRDAQGVYGAVVNYGF